MNTPVKSQAWNLRRDIHDLKKLLQEDLSFGFYILRKIIVLSRVWTREPRVSMWARYHEIDNNNKLKLNLLLTAPKGATPAN